MRPRQEIEDQSIEIHEKTRPLLILEVLLDIRDLLGLDKFPCPPRFRTNQEIVDEVNRLSTVDNYPNECP
jgi:hypothetical protein